MASDYTNGGALAELCREQRLRPTVLQRRVCVEDPGLDSPGGLPTAQNDYMNLARRACAPYWKRYVAKQGTSVSPGS